MLNDVLHGSRKASGSVHRDQNQTGVTTRGLCDTAIHVFGHHRLNLVADAQFDDLRHAVCGRAARGRGIAPSPVLALAALRQRSVSPPTQSPWPRSTQASRGKTRLHGRCVRPSPILAISFALAGGFSGQRSRSFAGGPQKGTIKILGHARHAHEPGGILRGGLDGAAAGLGVSARIAAASEPRPRDSSVEISSARASLSSGASFLARSSGVTAAAGSFPASFAMPRFTQ